MTSSSGTTSPTSPEKKHVAYLDGWRGIAIILVLLHHFCEFRQLGRTGVDCFFVLSGLLMSRILFVDKIPLSTFYKRRIARIFPVFYLYLAVAGTIFTLYMPTLDSNDLLYSGLFLRTYFPGTDIWASEKAPIGHLWSLHVEEHCYMLLSIISLLAVRYNERIARYVVTIAALGCLGFVAYYKIAPPVSESPIFVRTECAGFGLLISASLFLWFRQLRMIIPSWVPVVCAIAGIGLGVSFQYGPLKFMLSPLLLAIAVNTLSLAPAPCLRLLSNRVLVWFGVSSFSLYLWQQPFYFMTLYNHWDIGYAVAFALAMLVGSMSYYGYELPMRRWIRNLGER